MEILDGNSGVYLEEEVTIKMTLGELALIASSLCMIDIDDLEKEIDLNSNSVEISKELKDLLFDLEDMVQPRRTIERYLKQKGVFSIFA